MVVSGAAVECPAALVAGDVMTATQHRTLHTSIVDVDLFVQHVSAVSTTWAQCRA